MEKGMEFLPVSREEMIDRGWYYYDFLVVTADGYIDHPSFGTTLIARLLESRGYRVAILPQPDWHSAEDFRAMGKPRYGVLIGGGNLDSMVAHYTVAKRRRTRDLYSEGGEMGKRPDRPTIVYANRVREAWPDVPIVIGGLEASLRRFATTTTGTTRCGGAYCSTRRRTCWCTAWGRAPRRRSPGVWRGRHRRRS